MTAAFGIDTEKGYVAIVGRKLDSLNLGIKCYNMGVSGETSAAGVSRIQWALSKVKPDYFVLELGANDGLRGLDPAVTKKNLKEIIAAVRLKNPEVKIILAGMEAPPNMGADYVDKFRKIYPDLAKSEKCALIPFLLEGVAGEKLLNLPDGIHPNEKGQIIVANGVLKVFLSLLQK